MTPEVFRITNYGGERTTSLRGGRGIEYYAVVGLGPSEFDAAYALGLPQRGEISPDPKLAFMGPVLQVSQVREYPPELWIARVIYASAGTFNFSTRLGTRISGITERVVLPIISGGPGGVGPFIMPEPFTTVERCGFIRVDSRRYTGDPEAALNIFAKNMNKLYKPDAGSWVSTNLHTGEHDQHLYYQLADVAVITDAANNTRIDTYFKHRSAMAPIPAGTYPGQSKVIPELPSNADFVPCVGDGVVFVRSPLETYGEGEPLPWL